MFVDDEGRPVATPDRVRRVVSIVPSLTEAVALSDRALLVGATDWCTHPADLDVTRVRGTKNPDVAAIVALAPDLVVANQEENRPDDLDALRAAGVPVYVTDIRTLDGAVDGAFGALARMLAACGITRPAWLDDAERAWAAVPEPAGAVGPSCRSGDGRGWPSDATRSPAQCWPASASTTRCATIPNAIRASTRRRCLPHDLVVLPDEPYNFTAEDGPESFPGTQSVLVSGRLLTWYGPSLAEAARVLPALLQED